MGEHKEAMNTPETAPRDGQCVLLLYYVRHFDRGWQRKLHDEPYIRDGEKWEQCRWNGDEWAPWCGNPRTTSTLTIPEDDVIAWLPLPEASH